MAQLLPEQPGRSARSGLPAGGSRDVAFILDEDPDLAQGLSADDRRVARAVFRARVIVAGRSRWGPPQLDPATTFGLLILDGLIGRRVRVGSAIATELLGAGDILRPWDEPLGLDLVPPVLDWRVFRAARMAVLDAHVTTLIGRRPELVVAFSGRLLRRARGNAYLLAISHLVRVEDRLVATLWHLASTWGHVTSEGVTIPFRSRMRCSGRSWGRSGHR